MKTSVPLRKPTCLRNAELTTQLIYKASVKILLVVLLLSQIQCKRSESVLSPKIASLIGTWRLVDSDSTHATFLTFVLDTAHPPQDVTPFLATGKSAINDYSLRLFATIDGTMSSENWSSTQRTGTAAATTFEQIYFKNLQAVARYEMTTPNRLYLYHGGTSPNVLAYDRTE